MSLREASSKLLERAEKRRGQWTPKAGSWYFRYYEDYRKRNPYAKIGRCDFFHKVFLEMLYKAASLVFFCFGILAGAGVLVLVAIVAIKFSAAAVVVLFTLAGLVYLFAGYKVATNVIERVCNKRLRFYSHWFDALHYSVQALLIVFFAPVTIALGLLLVVGWCLKMLAFEIWESKACRWFIEGELLGVEWIRPSMLFGLMVFIAAQWVPGFWQADLFILAVCLVCVAIITIAIVFENYKDRACETRSDEDAELAGPQHVSWFSKLWYWVGGACSAVLSFIVYLWTIVRYLRRVICPVMVDPPR